MLFAPEHITLSELAQEIKTVLDENFGERSYWVIAEISDIRNYPERNYCFVSLIEKNDEGLSKLDAAIWQWSYPIIASFEMQTKIRFDKNLKLLFNLKVSFHRQYGLRLNITDIDASYTLGQIEKDRQETLDRLLKENPDTIQLIDGVWHTFNKGLQFPPVIQNIALITAPDSDGQKDFRHELAGNPYAYKFNVSEFLTQIQGQGAEELIMQKLEEIKLSELEFDAVVIVRGGGSQLDFGSFDTYSLAKAIALYNIPVVTGIGHERNVSISDLLSHTSVKTPTKAASFIIEYNRNFEAEIENLRDIVFSYAESLLHETKNDLDQCINEFRLKTAFFLDKQNNEVEKKAIAIRHLNPANILKRGFAIVTCNEEIITDPAKLGEGQSISVKLKSATITSTITNIENEKHNNI
jgi:exodeoxyribonuclease VII large subunit